MTTLDNRSYHLMGEALRDFGYRIDDAHVRTAADKILAGEQATSGPAMFIKTWLDKFGLDLGQAEAKEEKG